MKAVLLCGGTNATLRALSGDGPRALLPFLNRPWLEHQLQSLHAAGVDEVGLALSPGELGAVQSAVGDGKTTGVRVVYRTDEKPMGPAGCLRLFEDFLGNDPFLVIHANCLLARLDIRGLIEAHAANGALITLGLAPAESPPREVEDVLVGPDGSLRSFEIRYPDPSDVHRRKFAGVYAFSSEALTFLPPYGFVDIKEQLLSAIAAVGRPIGTFDFREFAGNVDSPEAYLRIQRQELSREGFAADGYREHASGVWVGAGASIAEDARLIPPLLIGSRSVVEEKVELIGPAIVGADCRIDSEAFVRESILWPGAHVKNRERLEYSVVGSGSWRRASDDLDERVRLAPVGRRGARAMLGHFAHRFTKRAIDIGVATAGISFGTPLFALIALGIKLDSTGPVFFVQRRLGRGGRPFPMLKFRTMRPGSERLQASMRHLNQVDGPVFKVFGDPRITRLGWLLRKTSLDELPQLVNVLLGQMSLVGPRPLVSREMRMNAAWRDLRLSVRPGITGLWQVGERSSSGFQDWIRHDVEYVLNASLRQDLRILWKTTDVLRVRGDTA